MPRELFRLAHSVRMAADDAAEVELYGEIVPDMGKYYKEWFPNDKNAVDFKRDIEAVRGKGATKLTLRINSPGGVVQQAVAMRSILASAGFESVAILIEGLCASAATIIATIPGANVQIAEGSQYMIHRPWGGVRGNADEIESYVKMLRNDEDMVCGFYAKRTGQSDEQIRKWVNAETWFNAEEAVKYGFADELKEADVSGAEPIAACVTSEDMAVMRALYKAVPEKIGVRDAAEEPEKQPEEVSNGHPVAGEPSENIIHEEEPDMGIKDANMEQLRAENPALLDEIQQSAIAAERQRIEDIDALTLPGYEEMAAKAKQDGTSAMDFHRQIMLATKAKRSDFMAQRKKETEPAAGVKGAEPTTGKSEEQEIEDFAKEVAAYSKDYIDNNAGGMF